MPTSLKSWYSQVTTGGGAAALSYAAVQLLTHNMSLLQVLPWVAAGIVGLIWPENKGLQTLVQADTAQAVQVAPTVATDAHAILDAFKEGMAHAQSHPAPASSPVAAPTT